MSEIQPSNAPGGSSSKAAKEPSKSATALEEQKLSGLRKILTKEDLSSQDLNTLATSLNSLAALSAEENIKMITLVLLSFNKTCHVNQSLAQMLSKLEERVKVLNVENGELAVKLDTLRGLNKTFAGRLTQAQESLATIQADCEFASRNAREIVEADTAKQMGELKKEINTLRIQVALQKQSLEKLRKESTTEQTASAGALALAEARAASAEGEVERLTKARTIDALVRKELAAHLAGARNIFLKAQDDRNTAGEVFKTCSAAFQADPNNESKENQMEDAIETMQMVDKKFQEAKAVWNKLRNITPTQVDVICQNAKACLQKDLAKLLQSEESPVSPTIDQPLVSKKTFADCVSPE